MVCLGFSLLWPYVSTSLLNRYSNAFRGMLLTCTLLYFSCILSDLEDGLKLLNEDLTFADDDSDSEFQPL